MERENVKSGTFADNIGVRQSTFSHVMNGKRKASLDLVTKVLQYYTDINFDWLVYGKGEMTSGKPVENALGATHYMAASKHSEMLPSLFDQNQENASERPGAPEKRREMPLETPVEPTKISEIQEIKYIKQPQRKITEIRIFFDDNTYETFRPEK